MQRPFHRCCRRRLVVTATVTNGNTSHTFEAVALRLLFVLLSILELTATTTTTTIISIIILIQTIPTSTTTTATTFVAIPYHIITG